MNENQKKRKSRWGEAQKKDDAENDENDNQPVNILENLALNSKTPLINSVGNSGSISNQGIPNPVLNLPLLTSAIHLNILKATESAKLAIEKAKRANQLKDEIRNNINKIKYIPKALKFDDQGREIDDQGNVINIKPIPYSTLKVNINKLNENNILKKKEILNEDDEIIEDSKWFDPRIKNNNKNDNAIKKKKNALNFIVPGSYIKQQATARKFYNSKSNINNDIKKMFEEKKKKGQSFEELSLNFLRNDININPNLIDINSINNFAKQKEWSESDKYDIDEKWDTVIFKKVEDKENLDEYISEQIDNWNNKNINDEEENSEESENVFSRQTLFEVNKELEKCENSKILVLENSELIINNALYKINLKRITKYIEHPVPLNAVKKDESLNTPHMFLTPLERKKLRKRKRQEKEREKQDKIRIGLIPPPPPKMKLSNLMRVLGNSAVAQPSRIELQVREQMKERELRHFQQNQERKLKPEEKSKKKINKWKSNPDEENEVLVIYITKVNNKKHIFKININAQQLHLTGVFVMTVLYNFIIVEGKHISIERYKRLIFRRIKWDEDEMEGDEDEEAGDDMGNGNNDENRNKSKTNYEFDDNNNNTNFENNGDTDFSMINRERGVNCSLIWSGTTKKKNFLNWKILVAKTEMEVTEYLKEHDAMHYFHIIKKHHNVLEI
ncbi:U4/U6 small nuclear ribonucleoprotein PRP3, putative [Plasmodium chabaudi chabaudi]|uniref:U4/U6 small nuclear ribonucleoprotein PRP3, putative n=1 Tax=Plasmodium chabaudi chabaudi TaxID=31271 RepID=A0A1C6YRP1_PLACU|nr:U4/U6 small nuclear ribonucleoprotein PRP3, putative [Plasmodium chabaudi chabaudi]